MTNAVTLHDYSPSQLRTIKDTVAKDTNATEFDLFMQACRNWGLDPFRKQIHCIVYNKDNDQKRRAVFFPSRDGLRVMAARSGDYRPASEPHEIEIDETLKSSINPLGITVARVRLWKQDTKTREWFPVIGEAWWDEFAPIVDEWAWNEQERKRKPTGVQVLQEGNWRKMPRLMISKCAEGQALRAGWPETFGGLYLEEEMDRMQAEMTASEAVEEMEKQERLARVGGPGLLMVFDDTARLEKVPMGQVADRVTEFLRTASPRDAYMFRLRNTEALKDFWAHNKADALEIRKRLEPLAEQFNPMEAAE